MNKNTIISIVNLVLEVIPIALFLLGNLWGIFVATAALMIGSILSIIIYYFLNKKLPLLTISLAILAFVFGALTLIFHEDSIIKIKVTVLNAIIAVAFFYAAFWKKNILVPITPKFANNTPNLFVVINNSWGVLFVLLAISNEVVWRRVPTKDWVYFKVFAIPTLVVIFALLQVIALLLYFLYRKNRVMRKLQKTRLDDSL